MVGEYRMPLITVVPFFANTPQYDMFNLLYDTDNFAPADPAQFAFVQEFQTGTRALIASLPPSAGSWAPTCLVHCLSGQSTFSQLLIGTANMAGAVMHWYNSGEAVRVASSCTGWDCVYQCGVNSVSGLPCNMGTPGCQPIQLPTDVNGDVTPAGPAPQQNGAQSTDTMLATGVTATIPVPAPTPSPQQASQQAPTNAQAPNNAQAAQQAQILAQQSQAAAANAAMQQQLAAQAQQQQQQAQQQQAQEQQAAQQAQPQQQGATGTVTSQAALSTDQQAALSAMLAQEESGTPLTAAQEAQLDADLAAQAPAPGAGHRRLLRAVAGAGCCG